MSCGNCGGEIVEGECTQCGFTPPDDKSLGGPIARAGEFVQDHVAAVVAVAVVLILALVVLDAVTGDDEDQMAGSVSGDPASDGISGDGFDLNIEIQIPNTSVDEMVCGFDGFHVNCRGTVSVEGMASFYMAAVDIECFDDGDVFLGSDGIDVQGRENGSRFELLVDTAGEEPDECDVYAG